ncbi:MAG: 2-oxo acid dehydrogenase subunit E2 [Deltaproteobacteria bacterium]|nr:2-oxo acid dehydrogenase subunit E2 [Deltaproteobacteria bacterium]
MAEDTNDSGVVVQATAGKKVKEVVRLKGIRKVASERLFQSLQMSAQTTVSGVIDMTEMVKVRQTLLSREKETGIHFTYTDLFVKVVAEALKRHPLLNSSLVGDEIHLWENINVGVALAFEVKGGGGNSLVVPVVHDADKKSLSEIHERLSELTQKGRNQRLLFKDLADGTFTITNVGVFGGGKIRRTIGTPIINQPEVAILDTMSIMDTPVARDGQVVIRPMMNYSLTFDHRAVMGQDANEFLATLQQLMEEEPASLLLA